MSGIAIVGTLLDMSSLRSAGSVVPTCAVLAMVVLAACSPSEDRSDRSDTTLPAESVTDVDAIAGVELPPAGSAGVVVQVPGEFDALIAAHAAARDGLRDCIDDHDVSVGDAGPRRFPC